MPSAPSGSQVARVFLIYLGFQFLIFPLLVGSAWVLMGGTEEAMNSGFQGWYSVLAMLLTFLCVTGYTFRVQVMDMTTIWELLPATLASRGLAFCMGSVSWLLAMPCVAIVQLGVQQIVEFFIPNLPLEQVAVTHLKNTLDHPNLFLLTVMGIVIFVPITEEILFRGFLQNWLRHRWSVKTAVLTSSTIFSLFHFSFVQGWSNIAILSALFVLAIILGLLYERSRSLWAPIGLHCTFNAVSAWMVLNSA